MRTAVSFLFYLLAQNPHPLFTIARSTNANVVHYDARLTDDGRLDPRAPVDVYWIMSAENGRRAELTLLEKKSAYGFTVSKESANCYQITLVAQRERAIHVCAESGVASARMRIAGSDAVLQKIFISTKRIGLWRGVNYVELFGTDAGTGEPRYENIIPH